MDYGLIINSWVFAKEIWCVKCNNECFADRTDTLSVLHLLLWVKQNRWALHEVIEILVPMNK